jgi:hypothetical protein
LGEASDIVGACRECLAAGSFHFTQPWRCRIVSLSLAMTARVILAVMARRSRSNPAPQQFEIKR